MVTNPEKTSEDLVASASPSDTSMDVSRDEPTEIPRTDTIKRKWLNDRLAMLQKEERCMQSLLVQLRNQHSKLAIEKMRLTEMSKNVVGETSANYVDGDNADDEYDTDVSETDEESHSESDDDMANKILETSYLGIPNDSISAEGSACDLRTTEMNMTVEDSFDMDTVL